MNCLEFCSFVSEMKGFKEYNIAQGATTIHVLQYPEFEIADYFDVLTDLERERCFQFGHIRRQREFVATRILRHGLFGYEHIHYDAHGAPFINGDTFISISHCSNSVAIAANKQYQVGLDLEVVRPDIQKIMAKFVSPKEMMDFNCKDAVVVSKIWSAKEALYKLAGRKKIHFKEELHLSWISETEWNGRILNPDHELHVKLNIFEQDGIIFTLNSTPIERIDKSV